VCPTRGYATSVPLALSVSREERCEVLACFQVVVKMYRYSFEERVFTVRTYWITGYIKNCQEVCWTVWWLAETRRRNAAFNFSVKKLILSYVFVLSASILRIPKTHNHTSLQVWHANILHFCSFCSPTFSGATREWDALYFMYRLKCMHDLQCSKITVHISGNLNAVKCS
jgi:hypothetical protein